MSEPRPLGMRAFAMRLVRFAPRRTAAALVLLILQASTEGVGLLMLVPFLVLVGSGDQPDGGAAALVGRAMEALGLSLSLPSVLSVFVALVVLRALLLLGNGILMAEIQMGFVDHLRCRMFAAVGNASWRFLVQKRLSDIGHAISSDINRISSSTRTALAVLVDGIVALAYVAVALKISWKVTVLAIVLGLGLELARWPLTRRSRELGEAITRANQSIFAMLSDFLNGLKAMKSRAVEARQARAFDDALGDIRARRIRFSASLLRTQALQQVVVAAALSALLYVAATTFAMQTAELLVLVFIFARLMPMLATLHQNYRSLAQSVPAFGSAMQLCASYEAAAESDVAEGWRPTLEQGLSLDGVSYRHDPNASRPTLEGIDLELPARATLGIVGPSGSGKSTLADLLLGLLLPDAGRVLVDGEPLLAPRLKTWRRAVGYVAQDTFLLHDSIRNNLSWAAPEAGEEELWEALRQASADGFVRRLPSGLDSVVGDRGVRLSGGERQRIALARALLGRPVLLILDEATSHVDADNERQILEALTNLKGKLTVVIIAHRPSTVRHADRVVLLDGGRIVEQGAWDELAASAESRLGRWLSDAS